MPAKRGTAAVAEPEAGTAEAGLPEGLDLAGLIQDAVASTVEAVVAPLRAELEGLKQGSTTFRPMDVLLQATGETRRATQGMRAGEERSGERSLPVGEHSHVLPPHIIRQYVRRFQAGSRVRLNRDVVRPGMKGERSWGEIMDGLGDLHCQNRLDGQPCPGSYHVGEDCNVCGEGPKVMKVYFLNHNGEWLYKVRVPGLTTMQGMAFVDSELSAA
jgi:hypothetical protein